MFSDMFTLLNLLYSFTSLNFSNVYFFAIEALIFIGPHRRLWTVQRSI